MSEPEAQPSPASARRSGVALIPILVGVAVTAYLLDVLSKILVVAQMEPFETVSVIGDLLSFRLVRNSGAAFSMATGYTWVLTFVALAVVLVIARYAKRLGSLGWVIGLGLVLGGALGNLTDRMFRAPGPLRGHVVDFIQVGSWWPTFNLADSAVVCGAILLVVLTLLGYDYDGTRTGWAARHDTDDVDEDKLAPASDASELAPSEDAVDPDAGADSTSTTANNQSKTSPEKNGDANA